MQATTQKETQKNPNISYINVRKEIKVIIHKGITYKNINSKAP